MVATVMKLSEAGKGHFKVVAIEKGEGIKEKLLRQGIIPGKEIEVINVRKNGPYVIRVDQTRIIIGAGMTGKIILEG